MINSLFCAVFGFFKNMFHNSFDSAVFSTLLYIVRTVVIICTIFTTFKP